MRYQFTVILSTLIFLFFGQGFLIAKTKTPSEIKKEELSYKKDLDRSYQLGKKLYDKREFERAKFYFLQILKKEPKNTDALLMLSYIYMWQNDLEKAIAGFQQILKDHPNYSDAQEGLRHSQDLLRENMKKK